MPIINASEDLRKAQAAANPQGYPPITQIPPGPGFRGAGDPLTQGVAGLVYDAATGTMVQNSGIDPATGQPTGGLRSVGAQLNTGAAQYTLSRAADNLINRGETNAAVKGAPQAVATNVVGSNISAARAQAAQMSAARMQGAQIDARGFNQASATQDFIANQGQQAISGLQDAAAGRVPSVAELQGQRQAQQIQQQAMALGASARGGADSRAGLQRQAMMSAADEGASSIANNAILRAGEMSTARGQLVGAIGQQQGLAQQQGLNALGLATSQANLTQGANAQNAGFSQQANAANQQASMQANLANQSAQMQASMSNQQNSLQAAQANQQARLQATGQNQQAYAQGVNADQAALMGGAGLATQGAGLNAAQVAFNNATMQQNFDNNMAMNQQNLTRWGVDKNVALGQYQAQKAEQGAIVGGIFNAAGTLGGAGIKAWG